GPAAIRQVSTNLAWEHHRFPWNFDMRERLNVVDCGDLVYAFGIGLLGGIGLVILVFVFHLQPGKPPVDVMLVIIAVVAASATLQA
ncbi:hypothetical protein MJO10_29765, partial [Salmonella enterica subsp. enterica serovar Anatum]|nr:hypothetical protein [Salmonella enterica subsp. enterica serovar Anatum]